MADLDASVPGGRPTLVVVSGPPGSGKTTIAHRLARAIGCPAVCRDEIKEGMVHAHPDFEQGWPGDPLTRRTYTVFFDIASLLIRSQVTVVAEAAFQHELWARGLDEIGDLADIRIIQCHVDPAVAHVRRLRRDTEDPLRRAHAGRGESLNLDDTLRRYESFQRLSYAAPAIDVDTTDGYSPDLSEITSALVRR